MEREKAVEIMLKDFDEISNRMRNISMRGSAKMPQIFLANSLVDIGYRKLDNPDNAIILSRKEFEMYKYFANVGDKEIEKAKQQARKETASRIFLAIDKYSDKCLETVDPGIDSEPYQTFKYYKFFTWLSKFAKKFGVELEE